MLVGQKELLRLTRSFLSHHLGWFRGGDPVDFQGWTDDLLLSEPPVLADSLERVTLAGLFADAYGLRDAGIEDLLLARPSIARYSELLERAWMQPPETLVFFTSGSTGSPKTAKHSWESLSGEVETLSPRFESLLEQPIRRVVSLVPPHHIYGFLWTFMYPAARKLPVQTLAPGATLLEAGDLVVAVPLFVRLWRERKLVLPAGLRILVSTAPMAVEDAEWLTSQGVAWLEIYGSTETGGIGTRTQADAWFELLPYWEKVMEGDSLDVHQFRRGNFIVSLPDRVAEEGRMVFPLGRHDGAVQVGGVNVFPVRVRQFLESQQGVKAAAVRLADSSIGSRLKAMIVPDEGIDLVLLEEQLRRACASELSSPERPTRFTFGGVLPVNDLGKEADWT